MSTRQPGGAWRPIDQKLLWTRIRTTPLKDLLGGRLTASLDVNAAIEAAELPVALAEFARRKCRRGILIGTRFDFAQSLLNRLRAALDAGSSPDELATSLNDAKTFAAFMQLEQPRPSWWWLVCNTPLSDALRGRLTGNLSYRSLLRQSGLPPVLTDTLLTVCRKTRLWRSEMFDVAQELCEHFRDGLDAGRTPEQLATSFGDVRQTARLIRRAKLRNRPWYWRAWRRSWQCLGIAIAVTAVGYFYLWSRLVLGHPTLAHNYALEITAPSRALAEKDRAWPLYRDALLKLTPEPWQEDNPIDTFSVRPGDKGWPWAIEWLDANQAALQLAREGAARPQLGFVYGDARDKAWYEHEHIEPESMDLGANRELVSLLLPHMQQMRGLARGLALDARYAEAQGDGQKFVADVEAILGMSAQINNDLPFLVVELIAYADFNIALRTIDDLLADHPALLTDGQLQRLAHVLAAYGGGGRLEVRFDGERAFMRDFYQRIYTDDGDGDGHLSREAPRYLKLLDVQWSSMFGQNGGELMHVLGEPALSAVMMSRRPMTELTEQMFDRLESETARPLWQWQPSNVDDQLLRWRASRLDTLRYLPIVMLLPAIEQAAIVGERATQQRDATLVALALEMYHRQHGAWPQNLGELAPKWLPAVPPDRYTGEPISYRLVDGRPLLYSVGPDGTDNAGKPLDGNFQNGLYYPPPKHMQATPTQVPSGDWILWPPQPKAAEPVEPSS